MKFPFHPLMRIHAFHVLQRALNEPVTAGLQAEQAHITPSPSLDIYCSVCYHANDMTAYTLPRPTSTTLSQDIAARNPIISQEKKRLTPACQHRFKVSIAGRAKPSYASVLS
jgi:hypothetical protein